jgi:hypothetical protein
MDTDLHLVTQEEIPVAEDKTRKLTFILVNSRY